MSYLASPLKWAGSKAKVLPVLLPILEKYKTDTFCEPFVGAANVSLNFQADIYYWNDLNKDLILTYEAIFENPLTYKNICKNLFDMGFDYYYEFRDYFNNKKSIVLDDHTLELTPVFRAGLFQYLNKHGFNGLCRYNKNGEFNVPIGTSNKPKNVPLKQIDDFIQKFSERPCAVITSNLSFDECFEKYEGFRSEALIYSDPPYVPLTSDFNYTAEGFGYEQQVELKELSKASKHTCIISNHWTPVTEQLYSDADDIIMFDVQRTISSKGSDRKKVQECIVIYKGEDK